MNSQRVWTSGAVARLNPMCPARGWDGSGWSEGRRERQQWRVPLALLLLFALAACGGGGGGGEENSPPSTTPSDVANVAGEWSITERLNSTCTDDDYKQYSVDVTQSGTELTVVAGGNSYSGRIDGSTVSWTGSYQEDGGTTTITAMTLTLSSDANTLTGSSSWQWVSNSGAQRCEGTTQVTGERAQRLDTTAPSAPSELRAEARSASQVELIWSQSSDDSGVTGYKIYRGNEYTRTVTGTQATESGLQRATEYCYQVSAVDAANNESAKSPRDCATTAAQADATAPTAPSNLVATSTAGAIKLTWAAASDNIAVAGYRLYRDGVLLATVTGTQASDTGVTAGTQYCYEVTAIDADDNESAKSAQQCATSGAGADATAPTAPTSLTLTTGATRVDLNWSASTDNIAVTGYKIYRNGQYVKSVAAIAVSDTGLSTSTQYCYQVTAVDAAGNESQKSTEQCGRTLKLGPTLAQPSVSNGSVQLSWTYEWSGLTSTADGYVLEESTTSATQGFTQIFSSANGTAYDRESPKTRTFTRQPGTYRYRVKAVVRGTSTDWSNVATATIEAASSTTLSVNPSADNALIYSTTNSSAQNTVYRTQDLSVGCNWAAGLYASDFVCSATALKFDIQSQIAGRTIISASLRLYPYILPADYNTTYAVNAYAASWSASSITFANQPNHYTSNQDTVNPPATVAVPLEFDVKAIVQAWANGTWTNNGFLLRDTQTTVPGYTAYRATSFHSVDTSTTKRPVLVIEYQ